MQVTENPDSTAFLDRVPDDATLSTYFETEWRNAILAEALMLARLSGTLVEE